MARSTLVPSGRVRLVLLSFLMLFVELALIRWTGSNIIYLSYFSNFVLLGSFLGIGVGFLRARSRVDLFPWAPIALAALVAFVLLFPVEIDRSGSELLYFGAFRRTGLPPWITLPIIFLAVAAAMAFIAQGVAGTFVNFEPLMAYRLDIVGSLAGIIAFSILSFLRAPPLVWGSLAAGLFAILLWTHMRAVVVVALGALVLMLAFESWRPADSWSPYYKISVRLLPDPRFERYSIDVNGIPHQEIQSLETRRKLEPFYSLPYQRIRRPSVGEVLIVGAGNGTDVALALAHGAERVDAVEIDPRLYEIGREMHPNRPYDDPRVRVTIDDGRAFLERTDRRYDLILFALPDSLTLVAGQSSLRLESYLFTVEAMRSARGHLQEGGTFAMYNFYREQWLIDRLERTLATAFGVSPCVESTGQESRLALLMVSNDPNAIRCPSLYQHSMNSAPRPATDDRPFPYLRGRTIPSVYLLTITLILLASVVFVRLAGGGLRRLRRHSDLFAMGAAFLLLETKSVVQFALLFGTTWLVNALVFAGVLTAVLVAIELTRHFRFSHPGPLYGLLLASLAVAFVVPQQRLLELTFWPRFGAAAALAFTPILLANLIFAERFRRTESSAEGFGANLLGAMVGGVLEYTALMSGYRILLLLVGALYVGAFFLGRRRLLAA